MSKRVLYSNFELPSYADYKEFCRECECMADSEIPSKDSQEFICWRNEEDNVNWEDFMQCVKAYDNKPKKRNDKYTYGIVVNGTLQLWDGKREIQPTLFGTLKQSIDKCISECDYVKIEYSEYGGTIEITAAHHDGTNVFTINAVKYKFECVGLNDLEYIPIKWLNL